MTVTRTTFHKALAASIKKTYLSLHLMNAISRPPAETTTERRERQLGYFRRAADAAMRAIDIASDQLEAAHITGEPGATASPTLDLARATRALVIAVNAENRAIAGQAPLRAPADDRRRVLLREELCKAAKHEPDPKRRGILYREIEERVEETLLADPDAEIETAFHLGAIADQLHLTIDLTKIPDEILGLRSTATPQPTARPSTVDAQPGSLQAGNPWDDG